MTYQAVTVPLQYDSLLLTCGPDRTESTRQWDESLCSTCRLVPSTRKVICLFSKMLDICSKIISTKNKIEYATKHPLFDYKKTMKTSHLLFPDQ